MKKLIIANWKMALGINESAKLAQEIAKLAFDSELVICPSYPYLSLVKEAIYNSKVKLGAQDCANRNLPAFTGGVSASQLKELGCEYAIVGHSERRIYAHETAQEIHDKIKSLLEIGITPILCLGEDIISYKAKETKEVISMQLDEIGFEIDWSKVLVAYEPIWAIGTGKVPTNEEIKSVAKIISDKVNPMGIIYGGSVNAENIAQLSAISHVKGFLIGSASTKLQELMDILR
ncbi:MAG: tpiA [Candidatus Midichloriaceae bacterium]|jgi:triosephosphate isomerase|nr:tpiA [Candidatus Midichloriaceae bacterium]